MRRLRIFAVGSFLTALTASLPASENIVFPKEGIKAVRFTLRLSKDVKPWRLEVAPQTNGIASLALELRPDKEGSLISVFQSKPRESGPAGKPAKKENLVFRPKTGTADPGMAGSGGRAWWDQDIPGLLRWEKPRLQLWLGGQLVLNEVLPPGPAYEVAVQAGAGAAFHRLKNDFIPGGGLYQEVELSHLMPHPGTPGPLSVDGIPFEVWNEGKNRLSLKDAGWTEWKDDPGNYSEAYDAGADFIADPRMPMVQVPKADYTAAYLLTSAEEDKETTNRVTLRAGRRIGGAGKESQVLIRDFGTDVPRGKTPEDPSGLTMVKIPLTEAFAQDIEGDLMEIEITKEIRLARRAPDPNRFRWRPLGLPSGVHIAAITLERSPIQMSVKPTELGALFEQPEPGGFVITLTNILDKPQPYVVQIHVGEKAARTLEGVLAGKQSVTRIATLPELPPGYHPVTVSLAQEADSEPLLVRHTAAGVLPADTRKYRTEAPWGTWDHTAAHFTLEDPEDTGTLMRKLGLRYGMFNSPAEVRARHGVVKGNSMKIGTPLKKFATASEAYEAAREKHPDMMAEAYIFHEDSISGGHASRIPDVFHDHPPYRLDTKERARFDAMWKEAMTAAKSLRENHPEVKLRLGNGPIPFREEFYRNKFPTELFDSGGNENPTFSRIPETQPPDPIGNNSSLWMDRQLLDAYGYTDKPVTQAHETIYPSTNPGNLSLQTQADYFVRNVLHSLAWRMPQVRPGSIVDAGNSYYHSNWGAAGLLTERPSVSPKPAALAMATLTSVLDGARYEDFYDTGSESAYLMRFRKQDNSQVLPFWVVRGEREFAIKIDGATQVRVVSPQGNPREQEVEGGVLRVPATASPAWLEVPAGASVQSVSLGPPNYPDSEPTGKVTPIDALNSLKGWTVGTKANPLLDYYNPMTPRRPGDFSWEPVADFAGRAGLKVTPRPAEKGKETMPMYQELIREKTTLLPGKPAEIGLWVNGNSAWGRIIFEMEDASGQRWTSIGAKAKGGSAWMEDWLGEELAGDFKPGDVADWNTDDAWGLSRINFDGWRYLGFPLPGQYPGEGYHWPANSQWKWDGDGIVHYPLSLKKIIVELPEKTLYLTRYAPARRPEIVLRNVVAVERDIDAPKNEPGDYVERTQITVD